jgi:hypothetical protein
MNNPSRVHILITVTVDHFQIPSQESEIIQKLAPVSHHDLSMSFALNLWRVAFDVKIHKECQSYNAK